MTNGVVNDRIQIALNNITAVSIPADVNDDDAITMADVIELRRHYGSKQASHRAILAADFNINQCVDMSDIQTLLSMIK